MTTHTHRRPLIDDTHPHVQVLDQGEFVKIKYSELDAILEVGGGVLGALKMLRLLDEQGVTPYGPPMVPSMAPLWTPMDPLWTP
jgi:hypothetical protein